MRIAFFNRSYWPDQAATGQLLTELAEDLVSRHGCEVTVVCGAALHAGEGARVRRGWRAVTHDTHNGVAILRANGTTLPKRVFAGRAANYLSYAASARVAASQIAASDIVVSLTDPPIIGAIARGAAARLGARFAFLCEDVFPEVAVVLEQFQNRAVNHVLDRINRGLLRDADAVVAIGERMRDRLVQEKGADPARVHVIHNWADCEAIRPAPKDNPFARAHGLVDRFVVMHSGNVGLSQNLDVVVAAAERLRDRERLTIVIVGDGAKRDTLEADAARRRLSNIRFLPYQAKGSLQDSFAAADVFLVSLRAGLEGYIVPSKLYGILAAGRPYVAAAEASCEAARFALEHGCGVWAPPGDPDALASAIARVHDDPAAALARGARARALAWRFDRRAAVDAYYDLFARLTGVAAAA
jgi:glycosyltransferase involved in cell wall biosynthesis